MTRVPIWEGMGDLAKTAQDYAQAFEYARELGYWRGLTEGRGSLARATNSRISFRNALIHSHNDAEQLRLAFTERQC